MKILRTRADPTRTPSRGRSAADLRQHRDALVGRLADLRQRQSRPRARVRSGVDGKLTIGPDGLLPAEP